MSEASAGSPPPARPVGPPLTGDSTLDVDPLAELGAQRPNLEHRRIVSVVRRRLFGSSHPPRIGRYTIEHRLGSGGMGEVYLAHDEILDRSVAVKVISGIDPDPAAKERFLTEARAAARLNHPNVVSVFEFGAVDAQLFIVMEYVPGTTLRAWMDDEPERPWSEVVELFLAAGRGLAAAHEAGLVHRDFKPQNVLLGEDARIVKVTDFGLAASVGDLGHERLRSTPVSDPALALSTDGRAMGTPAYMAPECHGGQTA
ncbi:MAG: serine/threonine protein kinase, partial [Myxococcales bacterium]|nr:serine/threonine protein kinase [Myxococcales bacterium]